jgi:hypothetical protein
VKRPRFRIVLIMLVVAITALNLGAIRAISDAESRSLFLICVVALPMANILAVGLLLAFLRARSRHFLRGFEVFGAMALAFFVVRRCEPRAWCSSTLFRPWPSME